MEQKIRPGGTIETVTREEIAELLQEFSSSQRVAFGGDSIERTIRDWPVKGHERVIRADSTRGDSNLVIAAAMYVDIVDQNAGRGGLSLINIGANPSFVYMVNAKTAQEQNGKVATGYLAPGASWDGKISDELWVGPVSVQSPLGTTLVWAVI